jgi:hypothetical protein
MPAQDPLYRDDDASYDEVSDRVRLRGRRLGVHLRDLQNRRAHLDRHLEHPDHRGHHLERRALHPQRHPARRLMNLARLYIHPAHLERRLHLSEDHQLHHHVIRPVHLHRSLRALRSGVVECVDLYRGVAESAYRRHCEVMPVPMALNPLVFLVPQD